MGRWTSRLAIIASILGLACADRSPDRPADRPAAPDTAAPPPAPTTPPDPTTATPPPDPAIIAGPPVVCADPTARDALGPLARTELGDGWVFPADYRTPDWDLRSGARGLVVADLDGDGHLDLVVPQTAEPTRLLLGDGRGGFADAPVGLFPAIDGMVGGSAADVDGDGDVDLFLYGEETTPNLVINEGGAFAVTARPDLDGDFAGCGNSASWADLDGDGDLDLFYGRGQHPLPDHTTVFCGNHLLLNDGAGGLVDHPEALPPEATSFQVLASGFHQFDADPWPELYLVAIGGEVVEGSFKRDLLVDDDAGVLTALDGTGLEVATDGMGIGAADLNLDGLADVVVPGIDEVFVLESLAPGLWVDASQALGIGYGPGQHDGWAGEWADLDDDGRLDLSLGFGPDPVGLPDQPDELYHQLSDGSFEAVGATWGFADTTVTRGVETADVNEDGWPDLVKRELGGVVVVDVSRCGSNHWLELRLRMPPPNTDAVGAWIEVDAGDTHQTRAVALGSDGFSTGGPPDLHVGLGEATAVDAVVVHWPDGTATTHGPLAADRRIEILHPGLVPPAP